MTSVYARADEIVYKLLQTAAKRFKRAARKLRSNTSSLAAFDEINLLYEEIDDLATDAYIAILNEGYDQIADIPLDGKFDIDYIVWLETQNDPVTEYVYFNEFRRKQERLKEAVVAAIERSQTGSERITVDGEQPDTELTQQRVTFVQDIDRIFTRAYNELARMFQQYAINYTDQGREEGMKDTGVKRVMWNATPDERTCEECMALDGEVFTIDSVPDKHWRCRCWMTSVK